MASCITQNSETILQTTTSVKKQFRLWGFSFLPFLRYPATDEEQSSLFQAAEFFLQPIFSVLDFQAFLNRILFSMLKLPTLKLRALWQFVTAFFY